MNATALSDDPQTQSRYIENPRLEHLARENTALRRRLYHARKAALEYRRNVSWNIETRLAELRALAKQLGVTLAPPYAEPEP